MLCSPLVKRLTRPRHEGGNSRKVLLPSIQFPILVDRLDYAHGNEVMAEFALRKAPEILRFLYCMGKILPSNTLFNNEKENSNTLCIFTYSMSTDWWCQHKRQFIGKVFRWFCALHILCGRMKLRSMHSASYARQTVHRILALWKTSPLPPLKRPCKLPQNVRVRTCWWSRYSVALSRGPPNLVPINLVLQRMIQRSVE